jgi:hypothetical protein
MTTTMAFSWWKHRVEKHGATANTSPATWIQMEGNDDESLQDEWCEGLEYRFTLDSSLAGFASDLIWKTKEKLTSKRMQNMILCNRWQRHCQPCNEGQSWDCDFYWHVGNNIRDILSIMEDLPRSKHFTQLMKTNNYQRKQIIYEQLDGKKKAAKLPVCCVARIEFQFPENKRYPADLQQLAAGEDSIKPVKENDDDVLDLCRSCAKNGVMNPTKCIYNDLYDIVFHQNSSEHQLVSVTGEWRVLDFHEHAIHMLNSHFGSANNIPTCVLLYFDDTFKTLYRNGAE